jgi:hypothetical protein
MIIKNNLDRSFGPAASFAGYILLIAGAAGIIFMKNWTGIVIAIMGAFASFTGTAIIIDTDTRKFRFYTKLFGIIKAGKWDNLNQFRELAILQDNRTYTAHSRSNRTISINNNGFGIYMLTQNKQTKVPIIKYKTREQAKKELEKLSVILKLPVVFQ